MVSSLGSLLGETGIGVSSPQAARALSPVGSRSTEGSPDPGGPEVAKTKKTLLQTELQ